MSEIFASLTFIIFVFFGGYNWGKFDGRNQGEDETRNKVILHCIEKPKLCKEEYDNIKTQNNLNNYERPEIK